ncbi:adenylyl-sulfate kinase [Methylophilaceae bacterium]|nr:adenylyl-sulfate kinase [Methylophilaceae bacterium]
MKSLNTQWQNFKLTETDRAKIKDQTPLCLWMTGLSGSGKSTLANALEVKLNALGRHTYILDGDNLRQGLNADLGFTIEARNENVRRAAEVARLMVDAGLIVIVGLISPLKAERDHARSLFGPNQFKEIYLSTSIAECEKRDVKGLYQKARSGDLKDFTGIDSPYQEPQAPEIELNTENLTVEQAVDVIVKAIL